MTIFLNGCVGGNPNVIRKEELLEFDSANKAIIVLQTTSILDKTVDKRIEMEWLNVYNLKDSLYTKNYKSTDSIIHHSPLFKYHDTELYVIKPGYYILKSIKHLLRTNLHATFYTKDDNISFSIKGGEVLYIGNVILNLKNSTKRKFFEKSFQIEDKYDLAQMYLTQKYPELLSKIQKRIIKIY